MVITITLTWRAVLALVGDAGSGKSTLLAEFLRRHTPEADHVEQPVVYCVADAYPEVPVLQRALMTKLGVPPPLSIYRQRWVADDLIQRALAERGTRVVLVDEMKHVENLRRRDQVAHWDWMKWLSTANRVSVVGTGIPGFESRVLEDLQLETRFALAYLPRWVAGPLLGQFLAAFERSLPLRRPSALASLPMQRALLKESEIKQGIEHAAIRAIENGSERITEDLLASWRDMFESGLSRTRWPANKPAPRR